MQWLNELFVFLGLSMNTCTYTYSKTLAFRYTRNTHTDKMQGHKPQSNSHSHKEQCGTSTRFKAHAHKRSTHTHEGEDTIGNNVMNHKCTISSQHQIEQAPMISPMSFPIPLQRNTACRGRCFTFTNEAGAYRGQWGGTERFSEMPQKVFWNRILWFRNPSFDVATICLCLQTARHVTKTL